MAEQKSQAQKDREKENEKKAKQEAERLEKQRAERGDDGPALTFTPNDEDPNREPTLEDARAEVEAAQAMERRHNRYLIEEAEEEAKKERFADAPEFADEAREKLREAEDEQREREMEARVEALKK